MAFFKWVGKLLLAASCLATLGPLAAGHAQAATEQERAGARAAATQGKAAFDAKHWADAVDLFSRAEALVHSPVHLLYKARALVELGQFVKAQETYVDVTREQSATPSAALTKAQEDAKRELAALEPRLASVTVKVAGAGAADAAVTMDGVKLPAALVGVSSPADPGAHTFQAAGNGTQSDVVTVSLNEGAASTVTLLLKPAAATAAAAPVAPVAPANAGPSTASTPAPLATDAGSAPQSGSGLRTASYVAFGVGAVGLAVGTVFALSAKSKYDKANSQCQADPCDLTQQQADQRTQNGKDGDSAKTLSLVGFITGGAGVALGTTLFILGSKTDTAKAEVHPWLGVGSLGLSGKF